MADTFRQAALDYHSLPKPGKIAIVLTTPAETQDDLSYAYSPGVAEPVREIAKDRENAYKYTAKGNTVAVITDGSAVLGLGNLGPLASKPVMEGKSLLFKRFAGIDSIDIEVDTDSPEGFIETVASIANTWGGINLEDIKAPQCFQIEKALIERCEVPVFHDDQHGTAIVTVAGMLSALEVQGKTIETAKIVCLGAGAAAQACCGLMIDAGAQPQNITMCDSRGVIYAGRDNVDKYKERFAIATEARTLSDAIIGADALLGLSGADLFSAEQLAKMAPRPIVFACSNPDPEINPELAHSVRDDLILATGRSDYPNQVNNVLCFPFLFRGTLDVRSKVINREMKLAAVHAIRDLAKQPPSASVIKAYRGAKMEFGRNYIIPKPTDERLLGAVSSAVARAAVDSGVARLPYPAHYPLQSVDDC